MFAKLISLIIGFIISSCTIMAGENYSSPAGYWDFDEGKGNVCHDKSKLKNDGRIYFASWTKGLKGSALEFDGNKSYVKIPGFPDLAAKQAFTLSLFVRPEIVIGGRNGRNIVGRPGSNYTNYYVFIPKNTDRFLFRFPANIECKGTGKINLAEWNHLLMTYDGKSASVYVNGKKIFNAKGKGKILPNTQPLMLGGSIKGRMFKGKIDEVKVYNRALKQEEIMKEFSLFADLKNKSEARAGKDITQKERASWLHRIKPVPVDKPQAETEIREFNGIPTVYVNGKPIARMAYTGYGHVAEWLSDRDHIKSLVDNNIRVYFLKLYIPVPVLKKSKIPDWRTQIDEGMKKLLKIAPQAYVIPRIFFVSDPEFAEMYPAELLTFNNGAFGPFTNYDGCATKDMPRASFASFVWERKVSQDLLNLINHIRTSNYADRVIGYFLTAGTCGEWLYWDFSPTKYYDYSPAMQKRFTEWLRNKYHNSVEQLRKAWNDKHVDFNNIRIPSPRDRKGLNYGDKRELSFYHFRVPPKDRKAMDYIACWNDEVADRVIYLSQVAKNATGGKTLVGAFWGYVSGGNPVSGKNSLQKLMASPAVDFWAAPPPYENRGLGNHVAIHGLAGSMKLHKKIWFNESDLRTYLSGAWQVKNVDGANNLAGTEELFKREFCHILTNNVYGYWYEMLKGWYNDPQMLKLLGKFQEIDRISTKVDAKNNSEIAVIVSEKNLYYCDDLLRRSLVGKEKINELCRIGAMPEYFELSDLRFPELQKYKLYIFLNAFALSDKERRWIANLKKHGKTLVWCYAPGLINPDSSKPLAVTHMAPLTGMKFAYSTGKFNAGIEITKSQYPMISNLPAHYLFGKYWRDLTTGMVGGPVKSPGPIKLKLQFAVSDDKKINVLGRYADTQGIAYAARQFPQWTSVYIGSIYPPAAIWKGIARYAGVHIYSDFDEDIVYHNKSFLALHTSVSGKRTIKLPEKCDVYDLFEGKCVGRNIERFSLFIPAKTTNLFFTGDINMLSGLIRK
ncbi:MAG: LamG domain-containing protein [Victivallaceae bacterium]